MGIVTGRRGGVLVVGNDELAEMLEVGTTAFVHRTSTAAQTEGIGIDVVVIAGDYPLEELTEVRVHSRLYDRPVVLVAPGHAMGTQNWRAVDVWPVTRTDPEALDEVTRTVETLMSRANHPSTAGARKAAVAS